MQLLIICLSVLPIVYGFPSAEEFEMDGFDSELEVTNEDLMLSYEEKLYEIISEMDPDGQPGTTLLGYSFADCGGPSALVNINSVSITPDPLHAPESISASFKINSELAAPIKTSVEIKREIFGTYVEIPCVSNVGSCNYDDLCSFLKNTSSCPFPSLGCTCPFKPNAYVIQPIQVNLPITSALNGKYKVKIATSMAGKLAFCAQIDITVG